MGSPRAQPGSGKEIDVWALDSVGMINITNHTALPLRQGNSVGCCLNLSFSGERKLVGVRAVGNNHLHSFTSGVVN
jgi:hypothetical protein